MARRCRRSSTDRAPTTRGHRTGRHLRDRHGRAGVRRGEGRPGGRQGADPIRSRRLRRRRRRHERHHRAARQHQPERDPEVVSDQAGGRRGALARLAHDQPAQAPVRSDARPQHAQLRVLPPHHGLHQPAHRVRPPVHRFGRPGPVRMGRGARRTLPRRARTERRRRAVQGEELPLRTDRQRDRLRSGQARQRSSRRRRARSRQAAADAGGGQRHQATDRRRASRTTSTAKTTSPGWP